jgi:streptogramin lyase
LTPVARFDAGTNQDFHLVQAEPGRALIRQPDATWLEVTRSGTPRSLPPTDSSNLEERHQRVRAADMGPQPWIDTGPDGLWLGSDRDGLVHLAAPSVEFWTHPAATRHLDVNGIDAAPDGSVWFMAEDGGKRSVIRWKDGKLAVPYEPLPIQSIAALASGTLLATSRYDIHSFDPLSARITPLPPSSGVTYLSKGRNGRVWIASAVHIFESVDISTWRALPLPDLPVSRSTTWLSVLELTNRNLWIGSIGYGAVLLANGSLQFHTTTNGAPSNILHPVLEDPDGTVWFASTAGLVRRRNGTWFRFGPEHGLPETLVLGAIDDLHGRLWVHGHQGIAGLLRSDLEDVASGRASILRPFRLRNAAAWVTECNGGPPSSVRDSHGNLWFATTAGALRVPREQLGSILRPAPTVTTATVPYGTFWREILQGPTASLQCPHDADQMLELTLAHPGAAAADYAPIQYRLDDIDPFWTTAPADGRIRYHHLSAGNHTLRLRPAEGGSSAESVLEILIPTRWHNTWAFRILAVGIGVGIIGVGVQHRYVLSQERLAESYRQQANARRWQIARDLHDGIGAGLARISILSNHSHPTLAATAQRLIRDLDELIWLTDPERDGLDATASYLITAAERQLLGLECQLQIEVPDQFPPLQIAGQARRHLIQILHGALSNVIKHSRATTVTLRMRNTSENLILEIQDNGLGFNSQSPHTQTRIGLRSFHERTSRLNGSFTCTTSPGNGTHLTFTFPLRNLRADAHEPQS